jgi:hypothetical protein
MSKKPDASIEAPPSRYCLGDDDKAVPLSSTSSYQPGQLDEYMAAQTKKKDGKRSHGQHKSETSSKGGHHHHHRNDRDPHSHSRAEEEMSTARSSRGQDDGVGALPVKMKRRTEADTKPRDEHLRNDPFAQSQVINRDIIMEENNAVARHPAAASYPGAVTTSGKQTSNVDTEPIQEKRSLASNLDDSFVTQTSALGVAALASISMSRSTGTPRAYKTHDLNSIEEEQSYMRVGAMVVPGLSPSRHTSDHSASTNGVTINDDSLLPPVIGGEQPLQAILVADRVTEETDLEAQRQARMRNEAEDIADMVHKRILQNTPTAVIHTAKSPKREDNEAGKSRKKIYILAGILVIAAAIGIALGITLSKPPPTTTPPTTPPTPPDPIEPFRDALVSISGESLYDEESPQYQALYWIANDDPAKTSVGVTDPETIEQRYVAAVLYFALVGKGWTNQYSFCSAADICSWNQNELSGIVCGSQEGHVESLNLSKSNKLCCMAMSPR